MVSVDHQMQTFAFYLPYDEVEEHCDEICREFSSLAGSHSWVVEPPTIEVTNDYPELFEDDLDLRFVRAKLKLYTALPPWRERLPRATDEKHFNEVMSLVEFATDVTRRFSTAADVFLDQTRVGQVLRGRPDQTLQVGLIDEWRRQLD